MMTLVNHIRSQTDLGILMVMKINWLQLISGKASQILMDTSPITYIKDNWIMNLQEYMHETYLTLKSTLFWVPKLMRQNDEFLMEAAARGQYTVKETQIINNWRIYFQAIRVSDICDGIGKHIMTPCREYGEVQNWKLQRMSSLKWPNQECPGKNSFKVWKKFLVKAFHMQANGVINQKFGKMEVQF